MRLPKGCATLEDAKAELASHYQVMEMRLERECADLATSGFADARLCSMAHTKFEEAFLILMKALRRGSPNDYAKQPRVVPDPESFTPPSAGDFDEGAELGARERLRAPPGAIEWHDFKP